VLNLVEPDVGTLQQAQSQDVKEELRQLINKIGSRLLVKCFN